MVLSPHAVISRYPNNAFNPLNYYQEHSELVQQLKPFIECVETALNTLAKHLRGEKIRGK